jgi:hypothetical protein
MLLDRPPHVQGRLCNVPPLSESDFEQDNGSMQAETFGETLNEANIFAINAVQLARTGIASIILFPSYFLANAYYSGSFLHY